MTPRRVFASTLVLILACAPRALAEPLPDELLTRLRSIEAQLIEGGGGAEKDAERAELARTADELRARLIDRLPLDSRVSSWLLDRAAYSLARLGDDGASTSVLLGIPTADQTLRVRETALSTLAVIENARSIAEQSTARLETDVLDRTGTPAQAAARAAEAEASLHTLVDIEQAQRIPFLSAECRVLIAASTSTNDVPDPGEEAPSALAASALQSLRPRTAALQAARDVLLVCAIINSAPSLRERARGVMGDKIRAIAASDTADAATRRRASLAMVVLGLDGAPVPPGPEAPWEEHLVHTESVVRRELNGIQPDSPARWPETARILLPLLRLVHDPAPSPEVAEARRTLVYAKAATGIDHKAPASLFGPELNLARAVSLLREFPRPSPAAESILEEVADRTDAPADVRADALWELGVALDRHKDDGPARIKQIATLGRLIAGFETHPRAKSAAEWLAFNAAPDWACLSQSDRIKARRCAAVRPEFIRAVRWLAAFAPDPRWGLEALRAELWSAPDAPTAQGINAAIDRLRTVTSAREQDAGTREIIAAAVSLGAAPVAPTPRAASAERATLLAPVVGFLQANASDQAPPLTLQLAEVRLAAADPEAAATFKSLIGSTIDRPASKDAARIRLGLAQALRDSDHADEAFPVLRDLAEQFEKQPGETGREEPYWSAWAAMLELLAQSGEQSRKDEILNTIARLELVDPVFGGGPTSERIRSVRLRVKGSE